MAKFVEVVKRDTGEVTTFVDITDESKDFISALYDLIERDVDHESFLCGKRTEHEQIYCLR